jgi:uncharacterized protein
VPEDREQDPVGGANGEGFNRERFGIVALGIVIEGGLGVVAWGLGRLIGWPVLESLRWEGRAALLGVAATVPLLGVLAISLRSSWLAFVRIRQFFNEIVQPLLGRCSAVELALLSIAAGFGEELLFRGLIQGALTGRLGRGSALAIASLLFGLLHPITSVYIVIAALMGAYLGAVWMATGNLLVVIIAHALYDFLALMIVLRMPASSGEGKLAEPINDAPASLEP